MTQKGKKTEEQGRQTELSLKLKKFNRTVEALEKLKHVRKELIVKLQKEDASEEDKVKWSKGLSAISNDIVTLEEIKLLGLNLG